LKNDPAIIQRSKELTDNRASEISKERNIPIEEAHQLVKSQIGGTLKTEDTIIFRNHGVVSVVDVIINHGKYDHEQCADPCEPEHGTSKAIFYANNGKKLIIHSMLHGGQNYYFSESLKELAWSFDDAALTVKEVTFNAEGVTSKGINDLAEDILFHNNFTELELDSIKNLMKRYLKISKSTLNKVIKSASVSDDDSQELTHHDIVEKYIGQHLPKSPNVVGSEGLLWRYKDEIGLYDPFPLTNIEGEIGGYFPGKNCKKGSDYKAIARLVYHKLKKDDFFSDIPYGVAAKSNFIRIEDDGSIKYEPYTPDHRQRCKLDVDPEQKPAPIFKQYLIDTFGELDKNPELILLQQCIGGLVSGTFRKVQRALLLKGGGSNGKSVLLELLENMFPPGSKSAVSPNDLNDDNCKADLYGKIINIVGELDETRPLRSSFKDLIGCDTSIRANRLITVLENNKYETFSNNFQQ